MQEYLNMFRYIVFSFLVADLIFNVDGCSSRAPIATCTDGIKNQGELDVDCGGPCHGCPGELKVY